MILEFSSLSLSLPLSSSSYSCPAYTDSDYMHRYASNAKVLLHMLYLRGLKPVPAFLFEANGIASPCRLKGEHKQDIMRRFGHTTC